MKHLPIAPSTGGLLISAEALGVRRDGRWLLEDVSLGIDRGEIVTLIGPNGAGKTLLSRVLLGLIRADQGRVLRQPGLRIGYVPQQFLVDTTLPLTVERFLRINNPGRGAEARAVLEETGAVHVASEAVQNLSGGEWQRVMLARALLRQPDLLILDEPVQGVDVTGQLELYDLIGSIHRERGCGVLLISHDLHLVMASTGRVLCLNRHICCSGPPDAILNDPAYINLFGSRAAANLALYHHAHDHVHDGADGAGGHSVTSNPES